MGSFLCSSLGRCLGSPWGQPTSCSAHQHNTASGFGVAFLFPWESNSAAELRFFTKSSFLYYCTLRPDFLPDAVPLKSFKKPERGARAFPPSRFPGFAQSLSQMRRNPNTKNRLQCGGQEPRAGISQRVTTTFPAAAVLAVAAPSSGIATVCCISY